MNKNVIHNEAKKRFEMTENRLTAYVEYWKIPGGMDFIATFVPEEMRGKGIGSEIAGFALRYARDKGQKVVATCPFIKSYIDKHKEFSKG